VGSGTSEIISAAEAPSLYGGGVVVGEDEPLVREGIVRVLEGAGFEVVGVAADAPACSARPRT
jgi:AmiR/NasT family two-component response regulator